MKVMAHRGYSGAYPENTMLAFRKAVEAGCDGIELDVHETRDGVLVVIHDEYLDRTTDGHGRIQDYSYEELCRFNAAKLWEGKYAPEKIPSFEEYCQWAATQDIFTNIEIKTDHVYYPDIERKTWDMIVKYGLEKKVMFSSFNHISLKRLQEIVPADVKLGALVLEDGLSVFPGEYCQAAGFQAFHPDIHMLDDANVKSCKDKGIELNVWTVNDMAGLEKLFTWGCEGIITNYPGVAAAWLKAQKYL